MKPVITAAAFAAACLAAPVALNAQHHSTPNEIVTAPRSVPGHISLVQWSGRVTQELESGLRYPEIPSSEVPPDGVVQVKFRCSDSGASDQVAVFKTSGSNTLDRAAVRAVKRLKQLHPLATGANPNQNYIAMVLFATTPEGHAKQIALINADAKKRNAWFKGGTQTASAGIMLAPAGY